MSINSFYVFFEKSSGFNYLLSERCYQVILKDFCKFRRYHYVVASRYIVVHFSSSYLKSHPIWNNDCPVTKDKNFANRVFCSTDIYSPMHAPTGPNVDNLQ